MPNYAGLLILVFHRICLPHQLQWYCHSDLDAGFVRNVKSRNSVILRNCWKSGTPPDEYILRRLNVHNWGPFFQARSIGDKLFMGPWDIFAGLWFEDFEQLDS